MARKKLVRPLPPLSLRRPFPPSERKADRLVEILRGIALKHQTDEPQVFYTLRDVAARFHVPISMVAQAYHRLEREGLLLRMRGSRTILEAANSARRLVVQGIICLPVPLSAFLLRQKWRLFFMCARQELRRRGFTTASVFFEKEEGKASILTEKIRHCKPDTVLWYMPDQSAKETVPALKDLGIPTYGICDGGMPAISCRYQIDREGAILQILRAWKNDSGIERVTILRQARRSAADEERLEMFVEQEGLSYDFADIDPDGPSSFLKSQLKKKQTGIIMPGLAASFLSFRAPDDFLNLCTELRVALVDGPVSMPFVQVTTARADIAATNWGEVAEGIADDLLSRQANHHQALEPFEAKAHLQVPLSEFAQTV